MTDTPDPGAMRPATITDADMHAAVHDLAMHAHSMSKNLRRQAAGLIAQAELLDRWRDRHGAAYAQVIDELHDAAVDADRPRVNVEVRLDMTKFNDGMARAERAMRDMQHGPVRPAGTADDPSCFTTRAATPPTIDDDTARRRTHVARFIEGLGMVGIPVMSFPGALPLDDDLADVLSRLDAVGDDGVPCPETMHADGPCRWCEGSGRVSIAALTRYIAETGHVDRARAVLGLRPVPA